MQDCTHHTVHPGPACPPHHGQEQEDTRGPTVHGAVPVTVPFEAGSDSRGHLWVTWGVYLWAGKPPVVDIILSNPPDLT